MMRLLTIVSTPNQQAGEFMQGGQENDDNEEGEEVEESEDSDLME